MKIRFLKTETKILKLNIFGQFLRLEFGQDNGILLPKLFWPTVRKECSRDQETLLKFEADSWEFSKILRSQEQFIQTVKVQNNFW